MIEISQIRLPCGADPEQLMDSKIRKILRLRTDAVFTWKITRHSVDARKKPELFDTYSVQVVFPEKGGRKSRSAGRCAGELPSENAGAGAKRGGPRAREDAAFEQSVLSRVHDRNVRSCEEIPYIFPKAAADADALAHRPVVAGFGPAGIFCSLMLARAGYRPIVLERGQQMERRIGAVERFWSKGELDPESNIQFGEGGAGTFSDGKLNSNVKDSSGRIQEVMRILTHAGAPEEIRYEQIPHIGTDRLREVIRNLREEILSLGGEIRFETKLTGLLMQGGRICGVRCLRRDGTQEVLPCEILVLAPGHSARDTVRELLKEGVPMTAKPFAVGMRVSHPQAMINAAQYGISDPDEMARLHLAPASYKLTGKGPDGRGVYSFCMCPGGWVVNASSEKGRLAVNGMSDYKRDSLRANSAIVLTVSERDFKEADPLSARLSSRSIRSGPEEPGRSSRTVPDFYPDGGGDDVLCGMRFQERLEEAAYRLCGGKVPVQRFASYEKGICDTAIPSAEELCIRGEAAPGDLSFLLPDALREDFLCGMHEFGRRIRGFDGPQAYVIGLESRTSSPVRILRDETGESRIGGLYPCGEGAGYAGGIMSAAVDGIRIAERIGRRYRAPRAENC